MANSQHSRLPVWLTTSLVVLVGAAWAANFFARFVLPEYNPNIAVDGMMTLILAAALGTGLLRGGKNGG